MLVSAVLISGSVTAETIHCEATYHDKAFLQATIWAGPSGFGEAECDYKNSSDKDYIVYHYSSGEQYYKVSGYWQSTMPGFEWCSIKDGNQFNTCRFAKREVKHRA